MEKITLPTPEEIKIAHILFQNPQIREYDKQLRKYDEQIEDLDISRTILRYKRAKVASEIANDPTYGKVNELRGELELLSDLSPEFRQLLSDDPFFHRPEFKDLLSDDPNCGKQE